MGKIKIIDTNLIGIKPVVDFQAMEQKCLVDRHAKLPPPPTALSIGTYEHKGITYPTPFGTYGNFSAIVGQSKSMKTFFKSAMLASYIGGRSNAYFPQIRGHDTKEKFVIDVDTEQSLWHTQNVANRVIEMVGADYKFFKSYSTRRYTAKERFEFIQWIMMESDFKNNIGMVCVDGVADITDSVNDLETANMIVQGLLTWTEMRNCHLMTIIHLNHGSQKPTGHLGSAIMKKAETIAFLSRDSMDRINVRPDYCRNREFETFDFEIDQNALPTQHIMDL